MSVFYFGTSDRPLFGYYHQPKSRPVQPDGVVLCNPMGAEYLRTHRAQRQLAARLADGGFHVLRFDYSGTGDSAGDGRDVSFDRWCEEVSMAADELKAMTAVRRVSLVGVRLGGALAVAAAAERIDVEDVALWDPVIRGRDYVQRLLGRSDTGSGFRGDARMVGVGGFPLPAGLRDELEEIRLEDVPSLRARRALLVVSEEKEEHRALADHLSELGIDVRRERQGEATRFDEPDPMETVVLAPTVVDAIADFLGSPE